MTNSKQTKRALLSSAMALVLCFAMLLGTTFAWFTDNASTSVNKIQAGKLDVALEMKDASGNWVSAEGKTLNFKTADNRTDNILWEPGATYELPELRIRNDGNLALKCKIVISGILGDADLNNAIEWKVDMGVPESGSVYWSGNYENLTAETEDTPLVPAADANDSNFSEAYFKIKGHMKEDAGNEYQGLSIEGAAITVYATQYTSEYDSYGNQYDEDATYDDWDGKATNLPAEESGVITITTAGELKAFADAVNGGNSFSGKTVKLGNNINLCNKDWTPIGQTGSEAKAQFLGTFDGNGKTISGLKVTSDNSSTTNGYGLFGWLQGTVKNLTVSGANITASHNVGVIAGYVEFGTISNCTVSGATITANHVNDDFCGDKVGGVAGFLANTNNSKIENCKVTDTTITAGRDAGQVVGCVHSAAGVTGCEATNVTLTAGTGCTGANMSGIIGRNLTP